MNKNKRKVQISYTCAVGAKRKKGIKLDLARNWIKCNFVLRVVFVIFAAKRDLRRNAPLVPGVHTELKHKTKKVCKQVKISYPTQSVQAVFNQIDQKQSKRTKCGARSKIKPKRVDYWRITGVIRGFVIKKKRMID